MHPRWSWSRAAAAMFVLALAMVPTRDLSAQPARPDGGRVADVELVRPDNPHDLRPAPVMSAAQRLDLQSRLAARREAQAGGGSPAAASVGRAPNLPVAGPTSAPVAELPDDLVQPVNRQNPLSAGGSGSTLTEPATAHKGDYVIYTGNTYASYSTNRGVSFTQMTIPAGPTGAEFECCDLDVMYDPGTDKFYWIVLYTDGSVTQGAVRIFVQNPGATGATPWSCSYTYQPGAGIIPDYPHLGLSANYLYFNTNESSDWKMRRYALAQLSTCAATPVSTFTESHSTYGHRVTVPARVPNGGTAMYWAIMDSISGNSATALRIYTWAEAVTATGVTSVQRAITPSNQVNPDCRGGTGNFDWIERTTAWSTSGFRLRAAVSSNQMTIVWNSAATSTLTPAQSQTQAHIRAAQFALSGLALTAEPHVFNNDYCWGFPQIAYNQSDYLGITGFYGGQAGGGGTAAQGFVGVDDDLTSGNSYSVAAAVAGTHNRSDSRWGDYTTVVRNQSCPNLWTASTFALNGGNATSNVDARYVEFGRSRDNCVSTLAVPGNFRLGTISSSSVQVLWNNTAEETYFRVVRWNSGGSYVYSSPHPGQDVLSYTFGGLTPGVLYHFWVQACNAALCSDWSPSISSYVQPTAPGNFRNTNATTSQIDLAWNDATGETGYQVVWTPAAGGAYTYVNLGAGVTGWTHTPVTANATYYYWLRSCAGALCSAWMGALVVTAAATPSLPSGFGVTSSSTSQIVLGWGDVSGETGYQIAWTAASPISYNFVNLAPNTTSWTHTPVTSGQTYYYHIKACAGANCSPWSGGVVGTAAAAPSAPTGFTRTGGTSTSATLAWNDVSGETGYRIAYWRSGASTLYWNVSANNTGTTVTGLTPGYTYYFWIQACTGAACSGWSGPVSGSTGPLVGRPDSGVAPALPPGGSPPLRDASGIPDDVDDREAGGPAAPPDDAPPPPLRPGSPPPPPPNGGPGGGHR